MESIQSLPVGEQVKFLETHAHCVGAKCNTLIMDKYFIYDYFGYDRFTRDYKTTSYGFIVHYNYDKRRRKYLPEQVIRSNPNEIQLIVDSIGLRFGE